MFGRLIGNKSYCFASKLSLTMRPVYPNTRLEVFSNLSGSENASSALKFISCSLSPEKYLCCEPVPRVGLYISSVDVSDR